MQSATALNYLAYNFIKIRLAVQRTAEAGKSGVNESNSGDGSKMGENCPFPALLHCDSFDRRFYFISACVQNAGGRSGRCQSTPVMVWLGYGDPAGDSGRVWASARTWHSRQA
jgi:hypothetical protein